MAKRKSSVAINPDVRRQATADSAFPYFAITTGQAAAASLTPKREWAGFRSAVPKPARLETTPFETQPLAADAGHPPVGFGPAATLLEWLE